MDTLSPPWRACVEQAWKAYCAGSLPIGAVITDKNGRIIASGRNRLFESSAPAPYLCQTRMAHAEINALLDFGRSGQPKEGATIYTSLEPCPMCLGAIRMYRLSGIAYAARDHVAGSIILAKATRFLEVAAFNIHPPPDSILEKVLLTLLTESLLRLTPGLWVKDRLELDPVNGTAVELGETLYSTNAFHELRQSNQSFWQLFARLSPHFDR